MRLIDFGLVVAALSAGPAAPAQQGEAQLRIVTSTTDLADLVPYVETTYAVGGGFDFLHGGDARQAIAHIPRDWDYVVDDERRMVGIITHDDVMDVVVPRVPRPCSGSTARRSHESADFRPVLVPP